MIWYQTSSSRLYFRCTAPAIKSAARIHGSRRESLFYLGAGRLPHEIIGQEAVLPLPGMIDVGRLERVMVEIGWYTVCGPENGGLGWLWKGWRCVRGVRGG
jgi:hypothetical protein